MKIGVIFCSCAGQISEKIDFERLKNLIFKRVDWVKKFELTCSEDIVEEISNFLKIKKTEALIILGCSPKNKESVFKKLGEKAGINPYMINIVNIREQGVWVINDKDKALKKAFIMFNGAFERLKKQKPLFDIKIPICNDIMIIGGGIAGIVAANNLSKAQKKVYLIEKQSCLGGQIVKYEKLFPDFECGPCMIHPMIEELLNSNTELRLNSEVVELKGFLGTIFAKILSKPIYVNPKRCIGCSECEKVCPVKAIKVEPIKLPAIARINSDKCLFLKGKDCDLCIKVCPVQGAIDFHESERQESLKVGAVLLATGFELIDCKIFPWLGYQKFRDIYNPLEFEEILNSEGPTSGQIITSSGKIPETIAIIHCVGSLDEDYYPYCSKICCQYAFKFNRVIRQRLSNTKIIHFVKEIVVPGKNAYRLYFQAINDKLTKIFRYENLKQLKIVREDLLKIYFNHEKISCDIIVLCPAITSNIKIEQISGLFLTGSVKEPMTIDETVTDAMAQVGSILCLLKGQEIIKQPFVAKIDYNKCSHCGICILQCPYKAIEIQNQKVKMIEILCEGCGACVACCPSRAIEMDGYSYDEILAEISGILKGIKEVEYGDNIT